MSSKKTKPLNLPAPFDVLSKQLRKPSHASLRNLSNNSATHSDPELDAAHLWSENEVLAIAQAWASRRPLLIRGEAGCGKSQLAKALSQALQVPLLTEVIHPRFEATDLLFKIDHVRRLADAQMLGALASRLKGPDQAPLDAAGVQKFTRAELPEGRYVQEGVLMQAFQTDDQSLSDRSPHWPRAVVLIDEIDKADSDLPNSLLGVLGSRSFKVPGREEALCCSEHAPLVLITTNEDRELPAAFVRRCAVLNIKPPSQEQEFIAWLIERARVHAPLARLNRPAPGDKQGDSLLAAAAKQVWADRQAAEQAGYPSVGLAEYIDLLYALYNVSGGVPGKAWPWLNQLSAFALVKHREQDQQRTSTAQA